MSKEAMKLALDALKKEHENYRLYGYEDGSPEYIHESIKALEEALAKQEQGEDLAFKADYWKRMHDEVRAELIKATSSKQEQGEPVGTLAVFDDAESDLGYSYDIYANFEQHKRLRDMNGANIYTTPQQHEPLTDKQIFAIGKELGLKCRLGGNPNIDIDYARAIEAAHGIKE